MCYFQEFDLKKQEITSVKVHKTHVNIQETDQVATPEHLHLNSSPEAAQARRLHPSEFLSPGEPQMQWPHWKYRRLQKLLDVEIKISVFK